MPQYVQGRCPDCSQKTGHLQVCAVAANRRYGRACLFVRSYRDKKGCLYRADWWGQNGLCALWKKPRGAAAWALWKEQKWFADFDEAQALLNRLAKAGKWREVRR